jgi:hypothetical protein
VGQGAYDSLHVGRQVLGPPPRAIPRCREEHSRAPPRRDFGQERVHHPLPGRPLCVLTAASGGRPPCYMCHVSLCTPYAAAAVACPKANSGNLAMRLYRSRTFSLCCFQSNSGAWLASVNGRFGPWPCALPVGCGRYPPPRPAVQPLLPHITALPCSGCAVGPLLGHTYAYSLRMAPRSPRTLARITCVVRELHHRRSLLVLLPEHNSHPTVLQPAHQRLRHKKIEQGCQSAALPQPCLDRYES